MAKKVTTTEPQLRLKESEKKLVKLFRQSRQDILTFVVKEMFNGVTDDDVIRQDGTGLSYKGETLSKAEVSSFRADAQYILKCDLWDELYNSLRLAANKKMFEQAQTMEDMHFGKAMLWNVDVIKKKLEKLASIK